MTSHDLLFKMIYCTEITPPLEIKEIFDFVLCEVPENPAYAQYEGIQKIEEARKEWLRIDYTTKKSINEELKKVNAELEEWMQKKRKNKSPFYDLYIEDCVEKKKKLKSRLGYVHLMKPNDNKERAKLVPIDSFLNFNSGGFTDCVFHKMPGEKSVTPSLKYFPKDNHVYCFSCTKRADAIDCMAAKESLTFNQAIKRLLNK